MTAPGCGPHAGLGAELRAVAVLVLDRLGPALDGLGREGTGRDGSDRDGSGREGSGRDAGASGEAPPEGSSPCSVCPVCAVVALLRGERPELAVRLADHAAGLLDVLRTALNEGAGAPAPAGRPTGPPTASPSSAPESPARRVQRIPVVREPARAGGGRC